VQKNLSTFLPERFMKNLSFFSLIFLCHGLAATDDWQDLALQESVQYQQEQDEFRASIRSAFDKMRNFKNQWSVFFKKPDIKIEHVYDKHSVMYTKLTVNSEAFRAATITGFVGLALNFHSRWPVKALGFGLPALVAYNYVTIQDDTYWASGKLLEKKENSETLVAQPSFEKSPNSGKL
jgi:hypothetical protein